MPAAQKAILEMNRARYPHWEFKIWGEGNITKERFPRSFELLQNIRHLNKDMRYSRLATMADIMRHEVMY
jgi:hypothetical protein